MWCASGRPPSWKRAWCWVAAAARRQAANSTISVRELGVTVVAFGDAEWRAALQAFGRFGRGRHKAALNFGDCLAYATAAVAGDSLLFVGTDFGHTDIPAAR